MTWEKLKILKQNSSKRSLKNLVVDKDMQNRLSLKLLFINFCIALLGISFLLRNIFSLRYALEEIPALDVATFEQLSHALISIVTTSLVLVIVTLAINYLAGLYLSHRFAGPSRVISDYLDDLIAGRPTQARNLRPDDELKEIMDRLNQLAETLKQKNNAPNKS